MAVVDATARQAAKRQRLALVDRASPPCSRSPPSLPSSPYLAVKAFPAIKYNGVGFLFRDTWRPGNTYANPVKTNGVLHPLGASYGAWPLIVGTVESSAIAVAFAVPISVVAALAVVEKLPRRLSNAFGLFLEVLAGIPSVVFGLWGFVTFGPIIAHDVAPLFADHLPDVPVLDFFRGDTGSGEGLLTASLVLAIMIVPIVAATTRDLLRQVPRLPKEGALALGMNDWEVARKVSLPWVRAGIIGASVLGLARALGRDDRRRHGVRRRAGHGTEPTSTSRSAPSPPPSSASWTALCPMAPASPYRPWPNLPSCWP